MIRLSTFRNSSTFRHLAWLVAGLTLLGVLQTLIAWSDQDLEFASRVVHGELQTPLLTIRPISQIPSGSPTPSSRPLVAVLIHGISASKSVMIPLGLRLAHAGMECHLLDLPGHGQSTETFSPSAAVRAIREVLNSLKNDKPLHDRLYAADSVRQVVIIGHSLGGGLALKATRGDQGACVVALSPAAATVTPSSPPRMLLILGEFDLPSVRKGSAFMFEKTSGISLPPRLPPGSWSVKDGSKRLVVLPWMDHTSTVLRDEPVEQILGWLRGLFPDYPFIRQKRWDGVWLRFGLCAVLLWLVALILGSSADLIDLIRRLIILKKFAKGKRKDSPPNLLGKLWQTLRAHERHFPPPLRGFFPYVLATFLAACLLLILNPWIRLGLLGGGFLAGFLCFSGVFLLIMKQPRSISAKGAWIDVLKITPALGFLVFLVGPEVTKSFAHLSLCSYRVWRIPWIFVSVLPFFLADEWASRIECHGMGPLSRWCFHLSSRCTLAIALMFGFFILRNREFLVVLILPALMVLSILCWVYSGLVYERTRSLWASAFWSAFVTGWFLSVFFAQQ